MKVNKILSHVLEFTIIYQFQVLNLKDAISRIKSFDVNRQSLYQSMFSIRLSKIYIAVLVLLFGVGAQGFAQTSNFTTFVVPNSPIGTFPTGINDNGTIVGWNALYGGPVVFYPRGFRRDNNGNITNIAYHNFLNGEENTKVWGTNNAGDIVGEVASYGSFKMVGTANPALSSSYVFFVFPGSTGTTAKGISNSGDIVGYYQDGNGLHGFKKTAAGVYTSFDCPNSTNTRAYGINTLGDIVGNCYIANTQHGFIFKNGVFTIIDYPGATLGSTTLFGINDAGEVFGLSDQANFKLSGGIFTPIAIPNLPDSIGRAVTGINNRGDITGYFDNGNYVGFKLTNSNPSITATVQTNPTGRSFTVDGVTYNSTQTFNWQSGAAHTIGTTSPQSGTGGTQYVWANWSDSGAISHTVSPTTNVSYTANFTDSLPQCVRPNLGWDFGDVLFGTSQEKTFTYTNNLPISFTPQNYTLEGAADYSITSNTCENTLLAPGQSCTWTAKFTARAGGLRTNEEFNLFTKPGLSNGSDCTSLIGKGTLNPNLINPRSYQITYPNDAYGYCNNPSTGYTIKNKGCALTSLVNAINYVLQPAYAPVILQTPPNLQDFIRSIDAYSHQTGDYCVSGLGNDVNFPKVTNNYPLTTASVQNALMWRSISIKNDPVALSQVLKEGYPVVVGIIQNTKKRKFPVRCGVAQPPADCFGNAHYVLAVGEDLQILDPERSTNYSFQDLINYRASKGKTVVGWQTIGQVRVKDGAYDLPKQPRNCSSGALSSALCNEVNLTGKSNIFDGLLSNNSTQTTNSVSVDQSDLNVVANDNVTFQIVDPQGRKTGYNSSTDQIEKGIPESDYYSENITGVDEVESDNGSSTATVSHPINGSYQVTIKANQTGDYSITINRSNRYAQSLSPIELNGTIQNGETKTFTFNYSFSKNQVDFDKDGNADLSVFRPSNSTWYARKSSGTNENDAFIIQWGIATDKIVPADYNGDGKTDYAVFRDGFWYILLNGSGFQGYQWGNPGDIPFPADFDGDGKVDLAVFRNGTWYVLKSSGGTMTQNWGSAGDIPVVADYDADNKADFAVYRNGIWYVLFSTGGNTAIQWGIAGDKTVAGDYNGDGKADYAVFRNGFWYILYNGGGFQGAQWGAAGDLAAPADYDGDGKTDLAVFRNGTWYIQRTTAGVQVVNFGIAGDKPVANAFVP